MSPHNRFAHRFIVVRVLVLLQNAHTLVFGYGNFAFIGFYFPVKDFKKGTFARAVRADYSVAVPFREFDIDVFEQYALSELQSYSRYL